MPANISENVLAPFVYIDFDGIRADIPKIAGIVAARFYIYEPQLSDLVYNLLRPRPAHLRFLNYLTTVWLPITVYDKSYSIVFDVSVWKLSDRSNR